MESGSGWSKLGSWTFIGGLTIAIIVGITSATDAALAWIIALLGLIVGLINIRRKETQLFLIGTIAFMITANSLLNVIPSVFEPTYVGRAMMLRIINNILTFVAPAAAIVSLKALYELAKD